MVSVVCCILDESLSIAVLCRGGGEREREREREREKVGVGARAEPALWRA
jgi:hypothetical protein